MKEDIKDRVKSYEDACRELGERPTTDWGGATPDEVAYKKLKTIVRALNGGWAADYRDPGQNKWFPMFCALGPSGFAFECPTFARRVPYAGDAARLCLRSRELAEHAGETFTELWEDFVV